MLLGWAAIGLSPAAAQEAVLSTPDAQSLAMGGTTMATLSGSHAIYGNPSAAVFSRTPSQISSSYFSQNDYDYYTVSGFWRFDNVNLAQAGWREFRREKGNRDMSFDLGYSRRIGDRWAVGAVVRYARFKRPEASADALSVDLSALYSMPLANIGTYSALRVGAKIGNLGGYLTASDYTLPMDVTVGAAWDTFLSDAHEVTLAADAGYYYTPVYVRGFQASLGAEYNLMQLFQFRTGYHFGQKDAYYPSYASLGAGVRFMHLRLDAVYLFAKRSTPLHKTFSISFGLDL